MRIYYIDGGPVHFFGTQDEAKKAARSAAADDGQDVTVELCNIANTKEAIVALANGQTGKGEVVYVAKYKKYLRVG